ncbi:MAG TPA: winged helix-turn-helix domain-containing protein [Thermoanaerobaculaceae bacterium]|nr:winged helix-turn-helix domain-containing protein [Thermoanaerobaculaceae bacterium]HPS77515.1 winged helix-turn-helix domain-containing protein [Thermoanaerobaculaceae bacterium]
MDDQQDCRYRIGEVVFDPQDSTLWQDGKRIHLTPKVLGILQVLVDTAPRAVTKEQLLDTVWPEAVVAEAALAQRVKELRRVLGDNARAPRYIETVARRGYRLVAPVARFVEGGARADPSPGAPQRSDSTSPPAPLRSPHPARWAVVALTAVLGIVAGLTWRTSQHVETAESRPTPAPSPFTPRRAVAVMEPLDASSRPELEWVGFALAEMLASELAAGGTLRVVRRSSLNEACRELGLAASDFTPANLLRLHGLLGVDLVIMGRSRGGPIGSPPEVHLDLEIRDATSGASLATLAEGGPLATLPDLAGRLAARLRQLLGVSELSSPEATRVRAAHPNDPNATRLYAEGLARLRVFEAPAALSALRRAAATEPGSPVIRAALADAWDLSGEKSRCRTELGEAFKLASKLPREQQLAIEAEYREQTGEWERAIDLTRSLRAFYPDNVDYGLTLVSLLVQHGQDAEAGKLLVELRSLPGTPGQDPRIDLAEAWMHESDLTWKLAAASRAAERAQVLGARLMLAAARIQQGRAYRGLGKPVEARAAFAEALGLRQAAGDRAGEGKALSHVAKSDRDAGELEAARQHLEAALRISDQLGNESESVTSRLDLGAVLLDEGRIAGGARRLQEALTRVQRLGEVGKRALVEVELARLELVRRRPTDATARAQQAIADAQTDHDLATELQARALLARALLSAGRSSEGREEAAKAIRLSARTDDRAIRLQVATAAAEASVGGGDAASARRDLERALAEAAQAPLGVRLEAELILAVCARRAGDEKSARTVLATVADLAQARGFRLISESARAASALAP